MKGIFSWIYEDEDEQKPELPLPLPLSTNPQTSIHLGEPTGIEEEDSSYADEYSTDEELVTDPEYHSADTDSRTRIDHIMSATHNQYEEPHELISLVYKMFVKEYGEQDTSWATFAYLLRQAEQETLDISRAPFKRLLYSDLNTNIDSCRPIPGMQDVFIVNKQLDFVYGRVVECALLRKDGELSKRAYSLFSQRRDSLQTCHGNHLASEKLCPSEWVLYVNTNTLFYDYCGKILRTETPLVDFTMDPSYLYTEKLPFYLVLFLCGEFLDSHIERSLEIDLSPIRTETYTQINQWKKLPMWLLALWYAGHPEERIKTSVV